MKVERDGDAVYVTGELFRQHDGMRFAPGVLRAAIEKFRARGPNYVTSRPGGGQVRLSDVVGEIVELEVTEDDEALRGKIKLLNTPCVTPLVGAALDAAKSGKAPLPFGFTIDGTGSIGRVARFETAEISSLAVTAPEGGVDRGPKRD